MIYPYTSIRAVHLEITDRCNAACPMCARYTDGEESSFIQNTHLSLSDIKNIFPVQFIQQLNRINFCGNYGDPIVARDLLPVIAYFKNTQSSMRIEVNTNGSARPVAWWKTLADFIGPDEAKGGVWFGLDGLKDTNHLYRRNTDWDLIMRNAEAYISAGGVAHWNFIAFKHNEHQIDEARALAKKMGFRHFNVKLTGRFKDTQSFPVIVGGDHVYDLEPAEEEQLRRPHVPPNEPSKTQIDIAKILAELREKGVINKNVGSEFEESIPKSNIDCIAKKEACIYVSALGLVYPCCWIGNAHSQADPQVPMNNDNIDPTKRSLKDIINGDEFQMVEDSWANGSIRRCVTMCSVCSPAGKVKYGPDYVMHKRFGNQWILRKTNET